MSGSETAACGARRTAAKRGSTADSRRLRSSRSRSALPTGRCMPEPSRARSIEATTAVRAGASSRACSSSSRPNWSFPPRPWTSHVRWIAPSPHDADVVLAGIELGGLMRSTDGGETWQDQRPGSQPDVHSLAWHPRVEGRAYEGGGGGAAWSEDGGDSWHAADEGRDRRYVVGGGGSCGSRALVRVREHRAVCSARDARRRPACAHLPEERRRLGSARGRSSRPDACDAVCARRYRQSGLRRARERRALGEPRSRGQLARV